MLTHADAVAKNRSARSAAGRVNGENCHSLALSSEVPRESVYQRALTRARWSRDPDYAAAAGGVANDIPEGCERIRMVVFQCSDGAGKFTLIQHTTLSEVV